MADLIRKLLHDHIGITDETLIRQLEGLGKIRNIAKGTHWSIVNGKCAELGMLINGLFRYYYITPDGKEQTDCIAWQPGHTVAPLTLDADLAPVHIMALEDSQVFVLPSDAVQQMIAEIPAAKEAVFQLTQMSLQEHYRIQKALLQYNAEQRYQWFLSNYPGLIDRVPLMYVASFLGITPVSLSRLRHKLGYTSQKEAAPV